MYVFSILRSAAVFVTLYDAYVVAQWSLGSLHCWHHIVLYNSVSQPPGRGPVPCPGINYSGPREVLLEFVINVF
jgi:hypothetical protein